MLVSLSCQFSQSKPSMPFATPPNTVALLPAGQLVKSIDSNGSARSYILYIPDGLSADHTLALVLVLHGGLGNGETAIAMSGFNAVADKHGFLVVYPNGSGVRDDRLLSWNSGNCCGHAKQNNIDDVGFIRQVAADVQKSYPIDPKRIYVTGMSNGAMMSQRLACEAADLFAAAAPVSGTLNYFDCQPAVPIAILEFHGTADQSVPYDGGMGQKSLAQINFTSVSYSIDFWVKQNGCPASPQTSTENGITHDVYAPCKQGAAVELYNHQRRRACRGRAEEPTINGDGAG